MSSSILDTLKPGYSTILSRKEYYELKDYVKRFCIVTSEYTEEDENRYVEQMYFVCNRVLYILTYTKHIAEEVEIYNLYRPF
jgi:hypothetical protein